MANKKTLKESLRKAEEVRRDAVSVLKVSSVDVPSLNKYNLLDISKLLPDGLLTVEVMSLNKFYDGIGMTNINGGLEFYASLLPQSPITIGEHGIIHLTKVPDNKSADCCIFDNFMDYLSFLKMTSFRTINELSCCDIILVGSVTNFPAVIELCEHYRNITCYFPYTTYGRTIHLTIKHKFGDKVFDGSKLFAGYKSLLEYVNDNYEEL